MNRGTEKYLLMQHHQNFAKVTAGLNHSQKTNKQTEHEDKDVEAGISLDPADNQGAQSGSFQFLLVKHLLLIFTHSFRGATLRNPYTVL